VFGKKNPEKVETPAPLFSWGEVLKALGSFPYGIPLKRIKAARKARKTLENALEYLSGEAHFKVRGRIDEIRITELNAIKELRDYVLKALADLVIEKLLEEEGKQND